MSVRATGRRESASPKEFFPKAIRPSGDASAVRQAAEECDRIQCPPEHPGRIWRILSVPAGCEETVGRGLLARRIPSYFPRIRCREQRLGVTDVRVFFPGLVFAALTDDDRGELAGSIFIEAADGNLSSRRSAAIRDDLQFMVLAEKLNCFCPFKYTENVPPPPAGGIPGCDFAELRGEHGGGYVLLIPGVDADQVFFRFGSIRRKIAFETHKNLFMRILRSA